MVEEGLAPPEMGVYMRLYGEVTGGRSKPLPYEANGAGRAKSGRSKPLPYEAKSGGASSPLCGQDTSSTTGVVPLLPLEKANGAGNVSGEV